MMGVASDKDVPVNRDWDLPTTCRARMSIRHDELSFIVPTD